LIHAPKLYASRQLNPDNIPTWTELPHIELPIFLERLWDAAVENIRPL
jgi:hypothetical protein